jgi:hypothetical protein
LFFFYCFQNCLLIAICTHDTLLLWARALTHNEELFVVNLFVVSILSRATHDKLFTESKLGFVMSIELTANPGFPVVIWCDRTNFS